MADYTSIWYETHVAGLPTPGFEEWWLGWYGLVTDYVQTTDGEMNTYDAVEDYFVRKAFAWHGWNARG